MLIVKHDVMAFPKVCLAKQRDAESLTFLCQSFNPLSSTSPAAELDCAQQQAGKKSKEKSGGEFNKQPLLSWHGGPRICRVYGHMQALRIFGMNPRHLFLCRGPGHFEGASTQEISIASSCVNT